MNNLTVGQLTDILISLGREGYEMAKVRTLRYVPDDLAIDITGETIYINLTDGLVESSVSGVMEVKNVQS